MRAPCGFRARTSQNDVTRPSSRRRLTEWQICQAARAGTAGGRRWRVGRDTSALVGDDDLSDVDRVRYTTIHGYRRAYIMAGYGPVLLLLHGIGDNADTWRGLIPALARDYTVIAPDFLGHGRSDRPRADYSIAAYACGMRDLLSVLDVEQATIIGHSLGGGVAMQFAYQFPERCQRLVLVSTGGVGRKTSALLRLVAIPGSETVLPLLRMPVVREFATLGLQLLHHLGTDLGRDTEDLLRLVDALPDQKARSVFVRTL